VSPVSYDQRVGRGAIGCIAVFMLPFLAAGVSVIVIGVREFSHGGATQQWLVPILAGAAFVTFSLGFMAMPIYALRRASADTAALQQGVIVDRSGVQGVTLFIFAIIWNAISWPILWVVRNDETPHNKVIYLVLIFPAIGALLLFSSVYMLLRRRKFGASRLMLDHIPVAVGTTFHGDIDTHVKESPEGGFVLRLMCVRRVVTGSGRNRSTDEKVLWADEQRVSASASMRNPLGTRIPFTFTVPGDARPSDERISDDMIVWRLGATAEVPGINYAADFQFPVLATGEHPHAPIEFAVASVSATAWVPSPESRIAITPLPEGGDEIRVTTRGRASETLGLLLFTTIWWGVVVVLIKLHAPLIFPIVFGLFGVIMLLAILDNLLGRSIIRASRTVLTLRREYLGGLGTGRTLDIPQIESVTSNLSLATQASATAYSVDVTLRDGTHLQAAKAIPERQDAEMLAARIRGDCGIGVIRDLSSVT